MVSIGPLPDEQQQVLRRLRRRAVGRVAERAQMVLLSARGYTVAEIAEIFEVGQDVVRTWLHRYRRDGPDGLQDRPRPGRPAKDRLARQIIDAQASNPPCNNGLVHNYWTAGLLAGFLAMRFHLVLSATSVRRLLRQAGWRWGRPRLAPAAHAPRPQRKEDPATALKLALIARALVSTATVLYLDECELQLLPLIRACWMKGPRWRIPTPGQNAKRAVFGALHAHSGRLHYAFQPRQRAVEFVAFLDRLVAAYPTGDLVLVLDNVVTHDARLVRQWLARPEHARVRLLWLPKYTAHEHNPIERVWGLLKEAVAANRLHGSLEELVVMADRFLATTAFQAPCRHAAPASPAVAA